MKPTAKFFHIKTDTQELLARVEATHDHEDAAASNVAEFLDSPIIHFSEIGGNEAFLKQMQGVQIIDPVLFPNQTPTHNPTTP